jgi:hypothetical protein
MRCAPPVVRGFSPLDEELALLPGNLTPSLVEQVVHLASWMPFAVAGAMVARFSRVRVPEATVRRRTEEAGAAYVRRQTEAGAALEGGRDATPPPSGPALQLLSVDGALVPLVHGAWAEVKTLAIGTVGEPVEEDGERPVHTHDLSYFSRLTDHETFGRLATVETQRRGTETAERVVAVVDGAEWEQGFIDLQRADAVRVLDWGHASEYVAKAGHAVFGTGTATLSEWLATYLHELKHGEPEQVLDELRRLRDQGTDAAGRALAGETREIVAGSVAYLEKRREQIRYAEFQAQGLPIGSGAVESANKLVVEARLKGAGMHWAPNHVNPMVALRTIVCSDRWDEAWTQIESQVRRDVRARSRSRQRRLARQLARPKADVLAPAGSPALVLVVARQEAPRRPPDQPQSTVSIPRAAPPARRPAPTHPWRHSPIGRARFTRACSTVSAET